MDFHIGESLLELTVQLQVGCVDLLFQDFIALVGQFIDGTFSINPRNSVGAKEFVVKLPALPSVLYLISSQDQGSQL